MTTRDEYLKQPVDAHLARLARTADDLAAAIRSHDDTTLSRRPEPKAWSTKEVVYHLDAERWAEERQYLRNDTVAALDAFRRRRGEALGLLRALTPEQWRRGGLVPTGARVSFGALVAGSPAHDDTHLAQLARALDGRP